jgi:threonylcarbamoyladenosine tRNA methylthiotransferase MtaB
MSPEGLSSIEIKREKVKKIALDSIGCKVNQAEVELLAREFLEAGYQLTTPDDEADVYILNTCTVTHIADRKSRHWLRLAHHRHPHALLVAIGCYAQRAPQELAQIDGVELVLGNDEKLRMLQLVKQSCDISCPVCRDGDSKSHHWAGLRTRTFIKVQDGCSSFCSYCIVPLVRGKEESLPVERVVTEVKSRVTMGYKEVVLTGIKIGSYNVDGINLKGLLEHILKETGVTRLRLSSLQPQEISPGLIKLWQGGRLCRHFHLSLQSGSNTVLNRMRRQYSTIDYQQAVSLIRALIPGAAITTDIIAGFPGETEVEFEESHNFCRQMEFARIHVFRYSPRQETQAARLPQPVTDKIKKQRTDRMLTLAKESAQNFGQQFLGRVLPVLWEKQVARVWTGLTDNYIKVYTKSDMDITNQLLLVQLVEVYRDGLWGEVKE